MEEDKEQVKEQNPQEQVNSSKPEEEKNLAEEEKILRPTVSVEEIIRSRENNNNKELTSRVEQYNFNQGFRNNRNVNESLVEVAESTKVDINNEEKIDIKPPRKKKNFLPLILLFLVLISGSGTYYYLNFYNKKEVPKQKTEQEEKPQEEKEKQNKTTCRKAVKLEAQKQNTIVEYIYYEQEDKLKGYEQNSTLEYLEEVPASIIEECNTINKSYEGYAGYSNKCIQNDDLSYTFSTKVDLTKLEEKTLSFDNRTITIPFSLDDDTKSIKEEYESANYECSTEEVDIIE